MVQNVSASMPVFWRALCCAGWGGRLHGGARAAHGIQALVQLRAKARGAHQVAQPVGVQVAHHHLGFHLQALQDVCKY